MNVLLVDDHVPTLTLQTELLRRAGLDARGVDTAAQAIANVRSWAPDVILLDLSMPDQDGLEMLIRIRLEHLCHVIVVSGLEKERLWPVVKELGASAYVEKGSDPQSLLDAVAAVQDMEVPPRRYLEDLRRRTLELV